MTTERWLSEETSAPTLPESVKVRQRVMVWPVSYKRRLLALYLFGFPERMLPRIRCPCLMESSSRYPVRRTGSHCPSLSFVPREMSDRAGQVPLFLNG
jgi:hypothetical protein